MSHRWTEVTRDSPCPVCRKPDWCGRSDEDAIRCMRIEDAPGWRVVTICPDGGTVYVPPDEHGAGNNRARQSQDWAAESDKCQRAITDEQIKNLAQQLGVTVDSLRQLRVGWSERDDCHTFPEHDADGKLIGLNRRFRDGTKRFVSGGKRGLSLPTNTTGMADPILAVEGASDTAACLTLGLYAVGRPNNRGGAPLLAALLEGRDILVIGENDQKPDGAWPGREGAEYIAAQLGKTWKRTVRWSLPPNGAKDVRSWLQQRNLNLADEPARCAAGRELLEALKSCAVSQTPPAVTRSPTQPGPVHVTPATNAWPDPMDSAAYYGLPGDIVRAIEPHTEADPVALLIQILVAFGNVIGRGAHFMADGARHGLNLFAVLIGETSKARKGTSWAQAIRLFNACVEEWSKERTVTGLSSGEGLIYQCRDPVMKMERNRKTGLTEEVVVDAGETDKRLLCQEPEFASVLRVCQRDGNTLSAIIRLAWDGGGTLRTLTKNSPMKATGAHISLIGHVVADELRRYLDRSEIAGGFGNRFLWLSVRRSKCLPDGGELHRVDFGAMVKRLADAIEFGREPRQLRRDRSARAMWHEVYADLSGGKPGLAGALIARGEAQVVRLAAVYALLDCSELIRPEHLQAALALWEYSEGSVYHVFGRTLGDPVADEIHAALRINADGLTRTEISALFQRNVSRDRLGRALLLLHRSKLAEPKSVETDGRPAEVWFAIA